MAQSSIFKFVLFGIFACGIGVVVLNFVSYGRRQNEHELNSQDNPSNPPIKTSDRKLIGEINSKSKKNKSYVAYGRKFDLSKIPIRTYKIVLQTDKQESVVVREAGEGKNNVLLLHGRKFSSELWKKLGTLQILAHWGFRAYAIDIPYGGNGSLFAAGNQTGTEWLRKVINKLHLSNLVIVSPSMSGRLTLPYMFELKNAQDLIQGFVYMAPLGAKQYLASQYEKIKIPTLIVHGERDKEFALTSDLLKNIPDSELLLIKNGSHNAYVEQPTQFHNKLRKFLERIYMPNKKKIAAASKKKFFSRNTTTSQRQEKD